LIVKLRNVAVGPAWRTNNAGGRRGTQAIDASPAAKPWSTIGKKRNFVSGVSGVAPKLVQRDFRRAKNIASKRRHRNEE
jgi:hypothetical protein